MTASVGFAYVQARLQARHGARPSSSDWRLMETSEDLAGYLQAAKGSFFRDWIFHLAASADVHQIERSLRHDLHAYCDEIGSWLSPDWRPSVDWVATLVYLPVIAHLARGQPAWRWMSDDPELARLAIQDPVARRQAFAATRFGELGDAISDGAAPLSAWLDGWLELADPRDPGDRQVMQDLVVLAGRYLAAEPGPGSVPPTERRAQLTKTLATRFRRWSGGIGAVFAHLGLIVLDTERLRAGLVLRTVLPRTVRRPEWA